jgi:hypothetical protein
VCRTGRCRAGARWVHAFRARRDAPARLRTEWARGYRVDLFGIEICRVPAVPASSGRGAAAARRQNGRGDESRCSRSLHTVVRLRRLPRRWAWSYERRLRWSARRLIGGGRSPDDGCGWEALRLAWGRALAQRRCQRVRMNAYHGPTPSGGETDVVSYIGVSRPAGGGNREANLTEASWLNSPSPICRTRSMRWSRTSTLRPCRSITIGITRRTSTT